MATLVLMWVMALMGPALWLLDMPTLALVAVMITFVMVGNTSRRRPG